MTNPTHLRKIYFSICDKRILIKTRPQYLRAEGFFKDEPMRAVIIRDFNEPITLSDEMIVAKLNQSIE